MSTADIERFVADLKSNASLLDEAKGVSGGLAAMVTFADSKGYGITVDEAKAYITDKANAELSDAQLDAVAGGKGHHHHSVTTAVVEAAQVATTVQAAAEVEVAAAAVTVAAEAVAAATTVAVAAEVAVVLT
ncbi:MAG: hypothetical protein HOI33_01600 [Rhodospirillaceae bacterium]|jgi:predicted ribosomally synthesized peptide with nif11-like leader|nr:hypothetical protein [Rhodospirillaceae bacterium]MBT5659171.1 hypothetical protein [Rhodospirillaceae bacterium]MBT5751380.1 hypothetical protein [Rhodospirillaceae bacterium]